MFGLPISRLLVASVIAGIIGVSSVLVVPKETPSPANIQIEPQRTTYSVGENFTVKITAEAFTPVNVFKGLILFDAKMLQISSIDYNTSLIDLWAVEPWYNNGEGTLSFTGGTTIPGGFTGKDTLLTITFTAKTVGQAALAIQEIRILKHDGLGTDEMVNKPIDSIFSITDKPLVTINKETSSSQDHIMHVLPTGISTDLNNDGKQSMADISIFMTHLATGNLKSDFNQDGKVGLEDLSIIMQ